jgi:hypothetical protein
MGRKIIGSLAFVAMLAVLVPASTALASDDDPAEDELKGVVEVLPVTADLVGDWIVGGTIVHVPAATTIDQEHGAVAVGVTIEAKGMTESDGSFTATKIEVEGDDGDDGCDDDGDEAGSGDASARATGGDDDGDDECDDDDFGELEFTGFIEALPATADLVGDWTVSGTIVHVTTSTELEQEHGPFAVGAAVNVEGQVEADGSVTAREVETEDADDVDDDSMILTGTATSVPNGDHTGTWRVSNHRVRVNAGTAIVHERRLDDGSRVRVFGTFRPNGSIKAAKVVVKK